KMPLWHHPGEDRSKKQNNNSSRAKCLRAKHSVVTVGDGVDLATLFQNPQHHKLSGCKCDLCEASRARGC
ncbi:hypothetical protein GGX14DRAFT_297241, partial [Mycena pura]